MTDMAAAKCNSFLGSRIGWAITVAAAGNAAYLLLAHAGHVIYALPYLLLLACPLMHLFGHHHGRHRPDQKSESPK